MENNLSKGALAKTLSKLKVFEAAKAQYEQYSTDSEIAAEIIWQANILGDFADKKVVDLGAGTGILGIGALLLGAKEVVFVEKDQEALTLAQENCDGLQHNIKGKALFFNKDICEFSHNADTVVMNPPFGTKQQHADKTFLEKAFSIASTIYTFHKTTTRRFVEAIAKDHFFRITHTWNFEFPLKATMRFHEQRIKRITVTAFRLQKV